MRDEDMKAPNIRTAADMKRFLRRRSRAPEKAREFVCRGGPWAGAELLLTGDYNTGWLAATGWHGRYKCKRGNYGAVHDDAVVIWQNV